MIYSELYNEGTASLIDANIAEAALDARLLLEYICQTNRNTLLAHPDREVSSLEMEKYRQLIEKRAKHIPLQHLTGSQEFMGLSFQVNSNVLVPRMDTEFVVEEALKYIQDGMRVLDICTGSGCILLSIMKYKNGIEGVGIDVSEDALLVAKENAKLLELQPVFLNGDLYGALSGTEYENIKFDVIISNPPYIRKSDISGLMPEVKDFEPVIALDGGDDGLDFYRRIIVDAQNHLTNYGRIFFEIGYDQGEEVCDILRENGFCDVTYLRDYCNNPRLATGKLVL